MGASDDDRRSRPGARSQAEDNLRAILDANADGVVVVDHDGVVCFANPAAEELFGRRADDLVGSVFGFPLVAGATTELDVVRTSDDRRIVEMRVVAIEWDGRAACLASLRDITDRARMEAERAELIREQAARMEAEAALRARDEFLAATAHELKTPLTRLRLSAQIAHRRLTRERPELPPYVEDALHRIDLESGHLSRLVGQLVDLPRIEDGTFDLDRSRLDLRELVETAVEDACPGEGNVHLRVRMPPEPVVAWVDRKAFGQIAADAIGNALRASPPGEPIEVELTTESPERSDGTAPRTAQLVVRDHGIAVPLEERPRLFGRSFQVHSNAYPAGMGVWLYVSRQLAEQHGGRIDLEFPDDGGTRVVVSFPLA
jgi:signal transduction histidine kinase